MRIRDITDDDKELEGRLRELFDEARATLETIFAPIQEARAFCERLKLEPHYVQIH